MEFHPVRYSKDHPVGVITCVLLGMALSHYGWGFSALPGISARGGAKVNVDD